jgi:hypothetical protein
MAEMEKKVWSKEWRSCCRKKPPLETVRGAMS